MIQAEATTPIPTGVVFWSHDKGTAKLIIQLKKGHINQTLSQGTIVPILLEFNSDTAAKGRGRHIYHAVIENALEGIVSIVLEENILGYQGRVDGSIYIELPDSRSLDTAGRFTFDIRRSPIDEDVPELEDYYWQGFSEIVEESKRIINQVESDCKVVLDNLNSKVTVLETQTTEIKNKQAEILKSIEDHDVFTKQESSANVVYQILGDEAEITITLDYSNKIAKSDIENPNKMFYNVLNALMPFTISGSEGTQAYYDRLAVLDNQLLTVATITNEAIAQVRLRWELVKFIDKNIPLLFETDDNNQKIDYLRQKITSVKSTIYGRGAGSGGNKLDHRFYVSGLLEAQGSGNTTSQISKITDQVTDVEKIRNMISSAGQIDSLIYSTKSDGNLYSILYSDYATLEVKMKISAKQVIEALMKTHHLENLATQEEAETGANNSKTMTPLRVFQAIAKWTKDKFVSMTENETVLGIKNFANGLQVGGRNVLSQNGEIVFDHTSETDSSIQSGIVRFKRYGDWILVNFNFQCRSTDIASGGNLIGVLEADIIPSGSIQVDITYDKALTIDASGKVTALWGLDANKYYIGSAMYFAKNKL